MNNNNKRIMYGNKSNPKNNAKKKKSTSPIRVLIKCSWNGARITVPTEPPILGKTTLLDIVLRLESALPPSLFQSSTATLVCLRKLVHQSDWESTTLKKMLDGDDGSAGVVLTLDLGADGSGSVATKSSNPVTSAISSAASSLNIKPVVATTPAAAAAAPMAMQIEDRAAAATAVAPPAATNAESKLEPMDVDNSTDSPKKVMAPEEAWNQMLQSNFDKTTKDCLNILLKIIDNILSRPNEPKVRSIRCANAAFDKKVGRCNGAFEFLYSIGFIPRYPTIGGSQQPEMLELTSENESREILLRGRKILADSAVEDLGMDGNDLPPLPKVQEAIPASTLAAPPPATSVAPSRSNTSSRGPTSQFNVYKTHSHNMQSAAMGAPDPYADAGMSSTERQLQNLQSKKEKLEREMQDIESDRGLVAYLPGNGPAPAASSGSGGKSDSSLVAARMKRMEEERKKREEGGFTTKAMRDLEKMKKAKVYSHAQIRVNFPDGAHLHAKFLPRETVSSIRSVIQSAFQPSLAQPLDFELYVAPPRRLLDDTKRLDVEELVPAAKIHVSWRVGASPSGGSVGSYLRNELFSSPNSNSAASSFPDAKCLQKATAAATKGKDGGAKNGVPGASREELLMQKMLGKKAGLLGGGKKKDSSSDNAAKKSSGSKPKWFKG